MSANKYKAISGGCKLSQAEKADRFMWRLSMQVSKAFDNYQMRRNGYKSAGLRWIIKSNIQKTQSQNK